jgi:invasion protein IalB
MKSIRACVAGALALGLLGIGAASADPAPTAPLTPSETKTFGDWTVRCYPIATPSPCDMYELLANKQTNQRVMSLSIAYMPAGDKHVIQIAVPLGVFIPTGLVIESDAYTSPMMPYRRCDRAGCYVESLFDNTAVTSLGSATGSAKIKIVADGGRVFEIPFSLKGYADAHGAMVDLARKKTTKPANTATPPAAPAPTTP